MPVSKIILNLYIVAQKQNNMKLTFPVILLLSFGLVNPGPASFAQSADSALKSGAISDIQSHYDDYKKIALQIWDYAEAGYKEVKSSALLQKTLTDNGFTVKAGVADIPTAFVATYGSGSPVIGILAEFDALPG